jgi:hypothetical protein
MTTTELIQLDEERGYLAAVTDRHRGRSYAEQGEDESNHAWHAGYAVGWNRGGTK